MYYNVFGEKVSRRKYKEMLEAAKNRRELIAAGLTSRRDLMKMGLLTAGGMLVAKSGLSARAQSTSTTPQTQLPGDGQVGSNQNCVPTKQAASPRLSFLVTGRWDQIRTACRRNKPRARLQEHLSKSEMTLVLQPSSCGCPIVRHRVCQASLYLSKAN